MTDAPNTMSRRQLIRHSAWFGGAVGLAVTGGEVISHVAGTAAANQVQARVVGQFGAHWRLRLRGDDAEAGDDLRFDGYDGVSVVDPRIE